MNSCLKSNVLIPLATARGSVPATVRADFLAVTFCAKQRRTCPPDSHYRTSPASKRLRKHRSNCEAGMRLGNDRKAGRRSPFNNHLSGSSRPANNRYEYIAIPVRTPLPILINGLIGLGEIKP